MHELLTGETSSADATEYKEEDDDEEGCVCAIAGEVYPVNNEGWRTPDSSWLDLKGEDDFQVYFVNVSISEDESRELDTRCRCDNERKSRPERSNGDSVEALEGHWGSSMEREEQGPQGW